MRDSYDEFNTKGESRIMKDSISRKIFNIFNICFFILLMATMLFPYFNVLAKALNEGKDTAMGGILLLPRKFTWENFETVIMDKNFGRALFISVSMTVVCTVANLCVQFMAAYTLLNKDLVGRKALMIFLLIPMYFGGGLIPQYILYSKIGLLNNFLVYVLPGLMSTYNTIIIRSYMESVPPSLRESARIDGANDIRIAFQIMLPLSKPVLATVALWTAVGAWSNWTQTLYFVTKKELFTLQYVLMQVIKEAEKLRAMVAEAALRGEILNIVPTVTSESVQSAQIIVTTLPIILVYPFLQKYFIQGVTLGAVKD